MTPRRFRVLVRVPLSAATVTDAPLTLVEREETWQGLTSNQAATIIRAAKSMSLDWHIERDRAAEAAGSETDGRRS